MDYTVKTYRFGDLKDGKLDYHVYETSSKKFEDPYGKSLAEIKLKYAVAGKPLVRNNVFREIWNTIPHVVINDADRAFQDMVRKTDTENRIDLITVEFGGLAFIRYCRLGQWFAFAEPSKIGFDDQTKWGDKHNYLAVWDGCKWVKPCEYDLDQLANDFIE